MGRLVQQLMREEAARLVLEAWRRGSYPELQGY